MLMDYILSLEYTLLGIEASLQQESYTLKGHNTIL